MGRCAAKVSRRAVALAVAGALAPAAVARAVNIPWTNAAGGNFGLATNWNSGAGPVPGVNDTAQFNIANTYTVTLNVDPSVQTVQVGGSNVTFANSVGGRTVTTSGNLNVNSGSFVLSAATPVTWTGNGANFNANATISNGNDLSIGTLGVGNANSSNTTFTGAGTSLSASGISTIANGVGTVGTLSFTGNATGTFDDIRAATLSSGTANINVFTGADVTAGQLEMANLGVPGTNANLTVDGVGSTLAAGPVFVGYTAGSLAAFTVSNSGVVTLNGQLTVDSTGKLDVLSAGKVTANTHVRVFSGSGSRGTLTVSGSGSLFEQTSSGTLTVGSPTGNTATLQVSTGGHYMTGSGTGFLLTWVRPAGVIDVAANGAFTANGNITIDGGRLQRAATGVFNLSVGKTLSVENGGDVHITGDYAHLNGAAINVTGAGSSFTQAGSGMLVVGGGSQLGLASAASLSAVGLNVGDSGGGSVTQSGGTASVGGGAGNRFLIAENAGSTGSYALSGGTLTVTNDNPVGTGETAIGLGGNGTFNQTGGQFVVNGVDGTLVVGYGTGAVPGAVGSYTVENGSLTADAMTVGRGNGAQGVVTVNNGGSIALTKQFMHLGMNVGATGTVNANAG